MTKISSFAALQDVLAENERTCLLLFKQGSEQSECALANLSAAFIDNRKINVCTADVTQVSNIHPAFGITSVPSLLLFEGNKLTGVIKGCQDKKYFQALAENSVFRAQADNGGKTQPRVVVYSTPTCSWCNTLKSWLTRNKITFNDVDVSRDQKATQDMVRRSGQQGVPQTEINGTIVVGFDQQKLKELLQIQ
jgi:glutaredoxin-like YruB-family protein